MQNIFKLLNSCIFSQAHKAASETASVILHSDMWDREKDMVALTIQKEMSWIFSPHISRSHFQQICIDSLWTIQILQLFGSISGYGHIICYASLGQVAINHSKENTY